MDEIQTAAPAVDAPAFDATKATAAAEAVAPGGGGAAAPAGGGPGPGGAGPGAGPQPTPPAHQDVPLAAHAVVQYADQMLWVLTKRHAKKAGVLQHLSAEERARLKFTPVDKEELLLATPGALPALAKYSDLIEKLGLGLFAFALYSIYEEKRELVNKAAEILKAREKPGVGFAAKPPTNGDGLKPDPARGIRPHGG